MSREIIHVQDHGDDVQVTMASDKFAVIEKAFEKLDDMNPSIDLISQYWGSQDGARKGDSRRCIFLKLAETVDEHGQVLKVAEFVWKNETGEKEIFRNASVKLVSAVIDSNIPEGTPLQITFKGKRKGSSGHSYDDWSMVLLG
jgi:hypothetical protein